MKNSEILECAESVYKFLICEDDHTGYNSIDDIPSFRNMNEVLTKYNTDMVPFTIFLNNGEPLWDKNKLPTHCLPNGTPIQEFFSTENSRSFYKGVIRRLKIEMCLK